MSRTTLEVRWFVAGPVPAAVRAWADAAGLTADAPRTDRYLVVPTEALSLKLRDGHVEAKRREADPHAAPFRAGRAAGPVEAWRKWGFPLARWPAGGLPDGVPDGWTAVAKRRLQRHDADAAGGTCTTELTEVEAGGGAWWSVGLEAAGPSGPARRAALDAAARRWLAREDAPELRPAAAAGYPAWLLRAGGPT